MKRNLSYIELVGFVACFCPKIQRNVFSKEFNNGISSNWLRMESYKTCSKRWTFKQSNYVATGTWLIRNTNIKMHCTRFFMPTATNRKSHRLSLWNYGNILHQKPNDYINNVWYSIWTKIIHRTIGPNCFRVRYLSSCFQKQNAMHLHE